MKTFTVEPITEDELRAALEACNSTNLHFGPVPDPPTPVMTLLKKLEAAREH